MFWLWFKYVIIIQHHRKEELQSKTSILLFVGALPDSMRKNMFNKWFWKITVIIFWEINEVNVIYRHHCSVELCCLKRLCNDLKAKHFSWENIMATHGEIIYTNLVHLIFIHSFLNKYLYKLFFYLYNRIKYCFIITMFCYYFYIYFILLWYRQF